MAIAYKLFKLKNGELHPLYIHTKQVIPIGEHLIAREGEKTPDGKVKSKLGKLAYRPGWHLTEIPLADHIGKKDPTGTKLLQAKDSVWCEVEFDDQIDYNMEAQAMSTQKRYQCLKKVPLNGFYWYTTNNKAKVRWLISGGIKVIRMMSNDEVAKICREHGFEPQEIQEV